MSLIWNFFTLSSGRVAICKDSACNFKREFPTQASTSLLRNHLKAKHSALFEQLKKDEKEKSDKENAEKASQQNFCRVGTFIFNGRVDTE